MKITTERFEYTCGRCGKTYIALQPAATYGTLIFRDESGKYAVAVDAISNPLFDRVSAAMDQRELADAMSARQQGEIGQRLVGRLSDPAPNTLSYDPDALPACDHCGAAQPSFWHSFEPPQTEEVDLSELRHDGWDALSPREQDQRLNDELDQILQG